MALLEIMIVRARRCGGELREPGFVLGGVSAEDVPTLRGGTIVDSETKAVRPLNEKDLAQLLKNVPAGVPLREIRDYIAGGFATVIDKDRGMSQEDPHPKTAGEKGRSGHVEPRQKDAKK